MRQHKRLLITLSTILLLALGVGLAAFTPVQQGIQRFRTIIVSGDANLNHLTVDGVITLNGGQVLTESFTTFIVSAPTAVGTATPVVIINTEGGLSNIVEVRKNSTPIAVYNKDGGYTTSGGATFNSGVVVAVPTNVGTATPAAIVNSASGLSNLFEARAASTPQFVVGPGGAVTVNQAITENGGSTNNAWAKVAAPTAIATATPAAVIDSAGVSNLLEVRDAATPVFTVRNGGAVIGNVLRYGTAGEQLVAGTSLVTGTDTAAHGLTTVTFALCTLGQDPTAGAGDAAMCTVSIAANEVTLNVWQDDFVTPATEVDVDVHWLVIGTP